MEWMNKHKFIKKDHPRMVRPIYPNGRFITENLVYEDFHDFRDGVDISDEKINEWIDKGLKYFEKYPDSPYWRARFGSGNTSVIILKWQDDDGSLPYYEIIVTKSYMSCHVFPNEPFERPDETF